MGEKKITLEHGGGGTAMMKLIGEVILKEFSQKRQGPVGLDELDDGAAIRIGNKTLVFTTDGATIKPLFYPGGDIGRLAIAGTVNDLAMMGGCPLALATAVVLREGFPLEDFRKICQSMDSAAREVNVPLVTGDTKVMEKDSLDGIIITTTGIGLADDLKTDSQLKPGEKIIATGTIGDHGATIMAIREGMEIEGGLRSDTNPIWETIEAALKAGKVSSMKDPTRGGASGALNEMASKSRVGILLDEDSIPISDPVKSIVEMLGIDPLNLTNEGKAFIGVNADDCDEVLRAIRKTKYGKEARVIGEATRENPGMVILKTSVGGRRVVRPIVGDPLPRIC